MSKYTCPHCKGNRTWQWKTKRGFDNHICQKDLDEKQARIKQEREQEQRRLDEAWTKWLSLEMAKYNIGDTVYYVDYAVTAPTHEQRDNRVVKVRYEEKRHYYSAKGLITAIKKPSAFHLAALEKAVSESLDFRNFSYVVDGAVRLAIFDNEQEAEQDARMRREGHRAHTALSRAVR